MKKKEEIIKKLRSTANSLRFFLILFLLSNVLFIYSFQSVSVYEKSVEKELTSQKAFNTRVDVIEGSFPVILLTIDETYVCEGGLMDLPVLVLDLSKSIPQASLKITNPFYIVFYSKIDDYTNEFRIVSPVLTKEHAGGVNKGSKTYEEVIYMANGDFISSKNLNITVIEINNAPNIKNIGVQTVWTKGDNSVFDYQVNVSDIEDGDSNSLNLEFNISFEGEKLFDISPKGEMYFKPNSSHIGVHNITVCVKDRGIKNPHEKINLCKQDGSSISKCNNFSLTVTDENRRPLIVNYSPINLSIKVRGEENAYFNITSHDPDGTLVDTYWYVDDVLRKYEPQKNESSFSFKYICGFYGASVIKAVVTDGELNNSVQWNLTVIEALCPTPGSGGGGGVACKERWVCEHWSQCKNLKEESSAGKVDYKTGVLISERCKSVRFNDENCGFQTRSCFDLKKCESNLTMPPLIQECYFTKNPNCNDGIKNCHSGSCEIGVDCGGPCQPCPTCNDGIKNQNEEGIDCGGVCSPCKKEFPEKKVFNFLMYSSLIFLILAVIGITVLGIRYIILKKRLEEILHHSRK